MIEKFNSDFRLVAKFFKNRRLGVETWSDDTQIKHVTEFMDFIAVFANDSRYENVKEDLLKIRAKGTKVDMCEYLDMLMAKGEARGIEIGRMEGEDKLARLMNRLLSDGKLEEMKEALTDTAVRSKLYEKYEIEESIKTDNNLESIGA